MVLVFLAVLVAGAVWPGAAWSEPAREVCGGMAPGSRPEPRLPCRPPAFAAYGDDRLALLIQEAIADSPAIRQALALHRAELQRLPQMTALPDPTLAVTQFARSPETRVGPQTTLVSVTQAFPGFGKRRLRGESASRAALVRAEAVVALRGDVVRRVKLAYYDLGYVDRALAINRQEERLLAQYEQLARSRYAQGLGRQSDVVRLQAEITRVLSRREALEWRRIDGAATLNAALGRAAGVPVAPVALSDPPAVRLDDAALAAAGRSERPEVRASLRGIEHREAELEVARWSHWPDFSVGAAWGNVLGRRDLRAGALPPAGNGKDVYSVTLGVNLPLFRTKYAAGVREAAERAQAARAAHDATLNDTERAIRTTTFRLRALERQMALFERTLLPQAEQAQSSTEADYAGGGADALDLLDGQRLLLDVRLGLAQLRTDYYKALADLERVAGTAVPEKASS